MLSPLEMLKSAFLRSKHPRDERLLMAFECDDSDVNFLDGCENVAWFDLDHAKLNLEGSCLNSLSDEGLIYVLPAYVWMFSIDYPDFNGWADRLLNTLVSKGRGSLEFTENEFFVINKLLLCKAEMLGHKYGAAGSTFGVRFDALAKTARAVYLDQER
jgi:hypothetical protein